MDFDDPLNTQAHMRRVLRLRKQRRRTQQVVGVLLLLAGYVCLAVSADTSSQWLLRRVAGGFLLIFAGFGVAIGPTISALLGDHD